MGVRRHRIIGAMAGILTAMSAVGCLARCLPAGLQSLPYLPDVIALIPWFAIPAALGLVLALFSRRFVTALVAVACLAAQVWWQHPYLSPSDGLPPEATAATAAARADASDPYARVMTANVYKGRADPQAVVDAVRDQRVEVLALQETTASFVEGLERAGIRAYLPYSHVSSTDGVYGNGLWSAMPLEDAADDDVHSSASAMPGATVDIGGTRVRVVSVHTCSPTLGRWTLWRTSIEEIGRLRGNADRTYLLMGDFNATTDHAPFRGMMGDRFRDAAETAGRGFEFTWPADRPGVPRFAGIDHIVVDRGIAVGQVRTMTVPGSDHDALLATVAVG